MLTGRLPVLTSFGKDLTVVVAGATGGLGSALLNAFSAHPSVDTVFALSRNPPAPLPAKTQWLPLDLEDQATIESAASTIAETGKAVHLAIAATGILHDGKTLTPEKSWQAVNAPGLETAYRINAVGPALLAKNLLPLLAVNQKSAFAAISARVGSIEDNQLGGWYAYRASKAALNMMIKTLAIELARKNPDALCVGLHPGTVDTNLSKPFQSNVPQDKLFSPAQSAEYLLNVLDGLSPAETGGVFAWDGQRIPG